MEQKIDNLSKNLGFIVNSNIIVFYTEQVRILRIFLKNLKLKTFDEI